jgi:hypothetical protein
MKRIYTIGLAFLLTFSIVGFSLAASATPGTISTDVFVMGLQASPNTTQVVADYWPAAGGASPTVSIPRTLTGYGGYEFTAASSGLPDGWAGSMIVSADHPVAAVGELMLTGGSATDGKRADYYSALTEPSAVLYFPFATLDRVGTAGDIVQVTRFTLQNTSASPVNATISYINRAGTNDGDMPVTIPANGATTFNLSVPGTGVPNLTATAYYAANDFWTGGLIVTAAQPVLAGAVHNIWQQYSGSYESLSSGGETIYLTNIDRRVYHTSSVCNTTGGRWAGLTSLVVQNFDLVNSVNITVTFYSKTTGASRYFVDTLPAGGAHGYNVRMGAETPGGAQWYRDPTFWDDIPESGNTTANCADGRMLWVGSAVVQGEPGANIAAVVINQRVDTYNASMYASVTDDDARQAVAFPVAYRVPSGTSARWNLLRIMNVGAAAASDIDIYFYNQDGTLQMSWLNQTAARYAIVDNANLKYTTFNALGTNWTGTIVVTSDQPIVATSDVLWGSYRYGAYNAAPFTP